MLMKLRDAQQTAVIEAWFDNLTDFIFRVEADKQVNFAAESAIVLVVLRHRCTFHLMTHMNCEK